MRIDPARHLSAVTVNASPGMLVTVDSQRVALMWFTVHDDLVVAIDSLVDPDRLATLNILEGPPGRGDPPT